MQVVVTDELVEVRLSWWQKALGLMRNITVARTDVSEVEVEPDALRVAMGAGIKVGLRLPWLYYVARTIRLDQVFVVRRHVPALSFRVANHGALQRVVVSTAEADALAERLRATAGGAPTAG
ncbi:MAG TPA: hypothetical protein VFW29_01665 [Solirubrobacteraceae bacterium]|nr:hypothetical protein [Solirubrobacteraceae bacterium]